MTHLDLTHHSAVIAGPPRSGRSTALDVIARAAAGAGVEHRILLAPWRSSLAAPGTWTAVHTLEDGTSSDSAAADLLVRGFARDGPTLIVIDDLVDLLERPGQDRSFGPVLARLVDLGRSEPVRLVAAAESDALLRCFDDGVRRLRAGRTGVLLNPDVDTHAPLLHAAVPRRSDLPPSPGRGWVVGPGVAVTVQVAIPDPDGPPSYYVTPPGGGVGDRPR